MTMDVDQLMKRHSLAELKEIEKRLRTDVERKKEDLRQLVASRYRELIDAADKIKQMHNSITIVTSQLKSFQPPASRQSFQIDRGPAKVVQDDPQLLDRAVPRLLHIAPEIIFLAIDADDPLTAALFFSFIKNVIWQWNVGKGPLSQVPEWLFLRSYEGFILDAAGLLFGKVNHEPFELCRYVSSVLILSSTTTKTKVLSDFLKRRFSILRGLLIRSSSLSVREALELSLSSIISTLRGVHEVFYANSLLGFVENESSAVRHRLFYEILPRENIPTIQEFSTAYDGVLNVLTFEDPNFVQNSYVRDYIRDWLNEVAAALVEPLEMLLNCVPSIQAVLNIRKTLDVVIAEENKKAPSLKILARDLNTPVGSVIDSFDMATRRRYSGLVVERLDDALRDVEGQLRDCCLSREVQIARQDFRPSLFGIETAGGSARLRRHPGHVQNVLVRVSPPVQESLLSPLGTVTSRLRDLWTDMCPPNQINLSDSPWILEELSAAYTGFFRKLSQSVDYVAEHADMENQQTALLHLHRFLRSLLVARDSLVHHDVPESSREIVLEIIKIQLDQTAAAVFQKWMDRILENWKTASISDLRHNLDPIVWSLKSSPFLKVAVEEKNEAGDNVKYILSIPAKASFPFENCLRELHNQLVEFSDSRVKTLITESAINRCFSVLVACYHESLQPPTRLTKNQALQWIFDVKVALAFGRGRKGFPVAILRSFNAIIDRLSAFVDPIDYSVLLPYLDRNVELYVESTRNLFFSITVLEKNSTIRSLTTHESVKSANISVIQFKPVWFSQLPITNPPTKRSG